MQNITLQKLQKNTLQKTSLKNRRVKLTVIEIMRINNLIKAAISLYS